MTRHPPLLFVLAGLAMAVAGWNLGGVGEENSVSSGLPPGTRSSRPDRTVRTRPGPTGEAAQRLEAIRTTTNPSERLRATIDLANCLPFADFAAWLSGDWFNVRGGMESTVFTQILLARWRQQDPEGLLLWCWENDSNADDSVISAWAETEPQRLLDFLKNYSGELGELYALQKIAGNHPEFALRRFLEMAAGISSGTGYPTRVRRVLEAIANQSPAALEAVLDSLPVWMKADTEKFLISRKMQDSFATEMRKLQERPDGLELLEEIYRRTSEHSGKLIDALPNLPAAWRERIASKASTFTSSQDAAKWAAADLEGAGCTAEQAKDIRASVVSHLERSNPETALKILAGLDLPPDQKERMLTSLFENFKDKPEKADALLTLLGSEKERQIARDAFQPPPSEPVPEIKNIEQPAEWLAAMTAPDLQNIPRIGRLLRLEEWEPEKLAALSAGFNALPEDKKRILCDLFLETGSRDDFPLQGEVLAYFVAHPPEKMVSDDPFAEPESGVSQTIKLATNYAVQLGKENPEKAGGWIAALPDGEAKWYAARNLQSVWTLYDPAAAERWLKTLPAATREKVKTLQGD